MIVAAIVTEATHTEIAITLLVNVPVGILPSKRTELLVPHMSSRKAWMIPVFPSLSKTVRIREIKKEKMRPKKASHATNAPCPLLIELSKR